MDLISATWLAPKYAKFLRADTTIVERPGWYQVITPSQPSPWRNEVVHSVLGDDAERVIDSTIDEYSRLGLPFKWCVGPPTRPANTDAMLAERGFRQWDVRGMHIDTAVDIASPDDVTIRKVGLDDLDVWVRVCSDGWDTHIDDRAVADHAWAIAQPERHFFIAWCDGEPVGTSGVIVCPEVAYLIGGQVLHSFRGRGIYRALLRCRLEAMRGVRDVAVTQAREGTSGPILERLGFDTAFRSLMFELDPRGGGSAYG